MNGLDKAYNLIVYDTTIVKPNNYSASIAITC